MTELIDIFDENGNACGSMERRKAHRLGHWHRVVHIWAWDGKDGGHIYFQKRATGKRIYGGLLDCTAAGHVSAGETVNEALREYPEELGCALRPENTVFAGIRPEIDNVDAVNLNREFQHIFITQVDGDLDQFTPDPGSVSAVLKIALSDLGAILEHGQSRPCLALMSADHRGSSTTDHLSIGPDDFIPAAHGYFLQIRDLVQRASCGEFLEAKENDQF